MIVDSHDLRALSRKVEAKLFATPALDHGARRLSMIASNHTIVWFEELDRTDVARVGGKNASLGEMVRHLGARGVAVPPGFATTADAYWRFVDANGLRNTIAAALGELAAGKATLAETGQSLRRALLRGDLPAGGSG